MTPKEKAEELVYNFKMKVLDRDGTSAMNYFEIKQCALIAVNEILETTKVKWATQRKLPNGEYRFWKGVAYKKYWQQVKQEIEAL